MENNELNKNSMFDEFKDVIEEFKSLSEKYGEKSSEHILPAMIILERKVTGENKHAIIGQTPDVINLLEWCINQLSEGYNIEFEKVLDMILIMHNNIGEHISLKNYKGEL